MTKPIETVTVTFEEFREEGFRSVSRYYYKDCLGNYVFIKTRDRAKAAEWLKEEYSGKYSLRTI